MAKIPPPAPVTVVRFDPETGAPLSTEVVKPLPDYKKRLLGLPVRPKSEWEPDEITMNLRIMGEKDGMSAVLCYAYRGNVDERLKRAQADHPDCRVWSEPIPSKKTEESAAEPGAPRSRASKSTMTDEDAKRVKFGDMSNVKVSEAAKALGLSYGQVYSAKNGYTFKHITG